MDLHHHRSDWTDPCLAIVCVKLMTGSQIVHRRLSERFVDRRGFIGVEIEGKEEFDGFDKDGRGSR